MPSRAARQQWPLLPYFDRVRRRFGVGPKLVRNRPVSPYSPKPLATAIVSLLAVLPRPLRKPDRSTKPATELVGIARLAASSPRAEAKRGTEYFLLPVRSILNQCHSERVPFRWTVNPYRGCEFGCKYCYARYTHEYMELDGGEFETKIYVKKDAGPLAERDSACERIWGEHIAIGTATDPYQPAEKEFGATRAILGKDGGARGAEPFDHDEVKSGAARYRFAAANFGEIGAHRESEHHDTEDAACAAARAARAQARFASGCGAETAGSGNRGGSAGDAGVAGADRPRERISMRWREA